MEKKKTFYITTPLYYSSGKLHLGHCYTTVICDSVARFKRMEGRDVFFLTGTDEHGQNIARRAAEKGMQPKEYVDALYADIKKLWELMDISYDKFIRTTDDYHEQAVKEFSRVCMKRATFTRRSTRAGTVRPASPSGRRRSLLTASAPTAAERLRGQRRKAISSACQSTPTEFRSITKVIPIFCFRTRASTKC